jgi:Protein of unknown function (DUF2878)
MAELPGGAGHRSSTAHKWAPTLYFVIGQAGWFACVMSAADGAAWIGVAFAVVLVTLHVVRVARPVEELKLLAGVVVAGGIWESALVHSGLLIYPSGTVIQGLAPYWILALWALFAAQFNTTYGWLKPRMGVAALLGAIAGPLSFRGGAALGAVRFARPWAATIALALGWAVLLPLLIVLSRRWNGVQDPA